MNRRSDPGHSSFWNCSWVGLFLLTGTLAGMPLVSAVAGLWGTILALAHVGPMLLGAIVGGAMA